MNQATNLFLTNKINDFSRYGESVLRRVSNANTIMDLVRAANSLQSAPGFIAWAPDVKKAQNSVRNKAADRAMEIVKAELEKLDMSFHTGDQSKFQQALGSFQRDIRYLGGLAPMAFREATKHLSTSYKPTCRIVDSGNPSLKIRQAITKPYPVNLADNEIFCVSEVVHSEDRLIASARLPGGQRLSIEYHIGRQSWVLTDESKPLSQQYTFASARDCVLEFEKMLGIKLPPIKMIERGAGVWEVHGKYATDNPWRLEPGNNYEVVDARGVSRKYTVKGDGKVTLVDGDPEQSFSPTAIWGVPEWRSLRRINDDVTEHPRPAGN